MLQTNGLNFEKKGFDVLGVDIVDDYVNSLNFVLGQSSVPVVVGGVLVH